MQILESKTAITKLSTVIASADQVTCELVGDAVILNLRSGMYYGLNPIGARIWTLIQESRTVADLRNTILEEYEVEGDRCEHDLLMLLQELAAENLIEVED